MINKKLISLGIGSILLFHGLQSCEETYEDIVPKAYNTIFLFKDSGQQELTIYDIGEDGTLETTIMKSGYKPGNATAIKIRALSSEELKEYSERIGKPYMALPSSLYELGTTDFNFSSSETYKKTNIKFKTTDIKNFLADKDPESNYVLPVKLEKVNANDSINADRDIILIKPNVVTPVISFVNNSSSLQISSETAKQSVTLSLPFNSLWDFNATLAVDEAKVPAGYTLIPADKYTFANNGNAEFKVGNNNSLPVEINIQNDGTLLGPTYALPIKIQGTSKNGIEVAQGNYILYAAFNAIPLTVDMLSTNAQEPSEGPIANLIDNNPVTFFHSVWSNSSIVNGQPHYIQIDLKKSVENFAFSYQNRNNSNGKPLIIKVMVSSDNSSWRELKILNENLPTAPSSKYNSPVMRALDGGFQYVRLVVMKTSDGDAPTAFNMAELNVYGK